MFLLKVWLFTLNQNPVDFCDKAPLKHKITNTPVWYQNNTSHFMSSGSCTINISESSLRKLILRRTKRSVNSSILPIRSRIPEEFSTTFLQNHGDLIIRVFVYVSHLFPITILPLFIFRFLGRVARIIIDGSEL